MKVCTLTPAYGRQYKSNKHILNDFLNKKDFILNDTSSPYDSRYVNIDDIHDVYDIAQLRYFVLTNGYRDDRCVVVKMAHINRDETHHLHS